jgi:hypothetical protein
MLYQSASIAIDLFYPGYIGKPAKSTLIEVNNQDNLKTFDSIVRGTDEHLTIFHRQGLLSNV